MATWDVREALCEIGRRCWQRGLVAANDGNFSCRLGANTILATPTGISKGFMTPEDLVLVDLDGNQTGGTRKLTSEIRLHLAIYGARPDVRSVVHVHPPHATAFAAAEVAPPEGVLEEIELTLGRVALVPYRPTGTWEFARGVEPYLDAHDDLLLAHHGAVTMGADPFDAYYKMESLDHACRILLLARPLGGGDWRALGSETLAQLLVRKAALGLRDARLAASPPAEPAPEWPSEPFSGEYPVVSDEPKFSSPPLWGRPSGDG